MFELHAKLLIDIGNLVTRTVVTPEGLYDALYQIRTQNPGIRSLNPDLILYIDQQIHIAINPNKSALAASLTQNVSNVNIDMYGYVVI
jgi:hypothetical protein